MTAGVRSSVKPLLVGLIVLGAVLSIEVVPGVFTVDDNNYLVNVLALRQGRVTLANTRGPATQSRTAVLRPDKSHAQGDVHAGWFDRAAALRDSGAAVFVFWLAGADGAQLTKIRQPGKEFCVRRKAFNAWTGADNGEIGGPDRGR